MILREIFKLARELASTGLTALFCGVAVVLSYWEFGYWIMGLGAAFLLAALVCGAWGDRSTDHPARVLAPPRDERSRGRHRTRLSAACRHTKRRAA